MTLFELELECCGVTYSKNTHMWSLGTGDFEESENSLTITKDCFQGKCFNQCKTFYTHIGAV